MAAVLPESSIVAVEPAEAMRRAWLEVPRNVRLVAGTSERSGLESGWAHLVTWAQSFHWVDREKTSVELSRILANGGIGVVVANQMNVSIPWVHRLTRIMRSGDVLSANKPPLLPGFSTSQALTSSWVQSLLPNQLLSLARTRSSYLRATDEVREKMQNNLRWYLSDHLGYRENDTVEIPYQTFYWELSRPESLL